MAENLLLAGIRTGLRRPFFDHFTSVLHSSLTQHCGYARTHANRTNLRWVVDYPQPLRTWASPWCSTSRYLALPAKVSVVPWGPDGLAVRGVIRSRSCFFECLEPLTGPSPRSPHVE
jgi:hypothetical protein